MSDKDSLLSDHGDSYIGSVTPVKDVIDALSKRGCPDLTSMIDLDACSDLPLAGGGFCDVYRGATKDGIQVAIKSLRLYDRPGKENDKEKVLKRAARELYHWSKLRHPSVLPLMGLAMFRGRMSMISEWMENGNLPSYISLNPSTDRISLCIDICTGLSYIHANEMIHGDLKGANVMVSQDGTAMIADFGNSQLKDLTLKFTNTTSSGITVRWAAPELLGEDSGARASKKTDVYAYGMTVLETLTGKVPYDEFSEHQVMIMVAFKHKTPVLPAIGVNIEIWKILQDCWRREPSERPDIANIEERLSSLYGHTTGKTRTLNSSDMGGAKAILITTRRSWNSYQIEDSNPDRTVVLANVPKKSKTNPEGLRNKTGPVTRHSHLGRVFEAELSDFESLASQKQLLGLEHPSTLQSMTELANTYHDQNRLTDAEPLYTEILAIRKRVLGDEHPDTLTSMANLANNYYRQGRLTDAEPLYIQVLAARKRVLGEHHRDTLQSMAELGNTYTKQGRLMDAQLLFFEVQETRKRQLGVEHPSTLLSMTELANAYYDQNRLTDAELLYTEVLAIRKRVLGEEHPDTLISMANLANNYYRQGRLADAEPLYVQVLAARKRVLGEHHHDTIGSMAELGNTYYRQRRFSQAEPLLTEVLAARKSLLGEDHPITLTSMTELANTFHDQDRLMDALPLYIEVLAKRKRVLGEDHPTTLISMANLANTYYNLDQLEEAEPLYVRVLGARKRVLEEDHCTTLESMVELGNTYFRQGRLAEARLLFAEALTARERVLGKNHPDTLQSMRLLARTYKAQGQGDQYKSLLTRIDAMTIE